MTQTTGQPLLPSTVSPQPNPTNFRQQLRVVDKLYTLTDDPTIDHALYGLPHTYRQATSLDVLTETTIVPWLYLPSQFLGTLTALSGILTAWPMATTPTLWILAPRMAMPVRTWGPGTT